MSTDPFSKLPYGRLQDQAANPFAEDSSLPDQVDEALDKPPGFLGASAPAGYSTVMPVRTAQVFRWGLAGLGAAIVSLGCFGWMVLLLFTVNQEFFTWLVFSVTAAVAALVLAMPAWNAAQRDALDVEMGRAIADTSGRWKIGRNLARVARWMAWFCLTAAAATVVVLIARLFGFW